MSRVIEGDCRAVLAEMPADSVHACLTDPPYHLTQLSRNGSPLRHYLRLITPPGGTVLDCFAGSGTTGEAAMLEGFDCILIERDPQSVADIRHRMSRWSGGDMPLFAAPVPEPPEDARIVDLFAEPTS